LIDVYSATWRDVSDLATRSLTRAIAELSTTGLDMAQTEYQRGRIAALKEILAMADDTKPVITDLPLTY
jgi:hypothetical protein